MRLNVAAISVVLAAALLSGCGSEDTSSDQSQDPFLFGFFKCGNGRIDRHEQCDGRNVGGETCASVTLGSRPGGTLRCNLFCRFDTRRCTRGGGSGGTAGVGGSGGSGGTGGSTAGTGGSGGAS
jgi:hypothetical protein